MKKIKNLKNKILTFTLAVACPLSATAGLALTENTNYISAAANSSLPDYLTSYVSEMTLSNNNFSSGVSNSALNSVNSWSSGNYSPSSTSGAISTGSTFQSNMVDLYKLSKNPGSKASDNFILMMNSVTDQNKTKVSARQNYTSSSVSLDANSYYSFQVAFKSMPTYVSNPTYGTPVGTINEENGFPIQESSFKSKSFGEYIYVRYHNSDVYVQKALLTEKVYINFSGVEPAEGETQKTINIENFYEDDEYVGIIQESKQLYVPIEFVKRTTDNTETQVTIIDGAYGFECPNFTYSKSTNGAVNYYIKKDTSFYNEEQNYIPENVNTKGSIYLNGFKDENGEDIEAPKFEGINSNDWQVFQFFVATGNQSQSIALDLWLGSKGLDSSGAVFFDDVHVYKYSENAFWNICSKQIGSFYKQDFIDDHNNVLMSQTIRTTKLVDLRSENDKEIKFKNANFDFETPISSGDPVPEWTVNGTGRAQTFEVKDYAFFRKETNNNFVGNDLSVKNLKIVYDEENQIATITSEANARVLGIFNEEENYTTVTSNQIINIDANKVYKISAKYKISDIESGNAYMFVQEYDGADSIIKSQYGLKEYEFKPLQQSSAITSSNSNAYQNNYGTVEFYVKGGIYYNSSIKFGFQLGTEESLAKGCIVFDNVKIEESTSEAYESASNKLQLGQSIETNSDFDINSDFNEVSNDGSGKLLSPAKWTLTNGGKAGTLGGVVTTDTVQYNAAKQKYDELNQNNITDSENPYYWATFANPGDMRNLTSSNKLMLANTNPDWQKAKSSSFKINAGEDGKTYKLSFDFLNRSRQGFKVSLFGEDGFKLYESKALTNDAWTTYDIYLKSLKEGANNIYIEIDLGTKTDNNDSLAQGVVYVDNFKLETISDNMRPQSADVVEMTNFYLDLPTNTISDDPEESVLPAYDGVTSDKTVIKSNSFKFAEGQSLYLSDEYLKDENGEYKNVFYIQGLKNGVYTLQSKFNIDLENEYYALTFKVKTAFETSKLKSGDFEYGATVGLTGFEYATKIRTDTQEPQEYTIYFHPSEATTAKLYIALNCNAETTGNEDFGGEMALFDIVLHKTTFDSGENEGASIEELYEAARTTSDSKEYDINKDKVYVSTRTDDTNTPDDNTDTETETSASGNGFDWLLIPTLITALAIVIAVVGWLLRKIKIKKIERKRIETYDRDKSLHIDAIKKQAKTERDAEVAQTTDTINKFKAELDRLEKEHKQKVIQLRDKDKGKVSKNTDKEFKLFAKKRTVIAEKIDSLNKELDELKSPEHLLALERKAYLIQEAKRRELEKVSKKENKKVQKTQVQEEKPAEKTSKTKRPKK